MDEHSARPLVNIVGEKVALGPMRRDLVPLYQKWDTTAEYGIVIGEQDCQGKGYGTEVTRLMLDYAFTVLGLHNILLTVVEYNLAGIHAYEKAGFRLIGRRRQAKWMNRKLWDVIYMDCLSTEFESPVLGRLFVPDEPRGA
jgi:RimJ/RimL family protein N-acetyltransferase